jgi:hypothetical protein
VKGGGVVEYWRDGVLECGILDKKRRLPGRVQRCSGRTAYKFLACH